MNRVAIQVAEGLAVSGPGEQFVDIQDLSQFTSGVIYLTAPDASDVDGVAFLNLVEVDPYSGFLMESATVGAIAASSGPGSQFQAAASVSVLRGTRYQIGFGLSGASASGTFSVTFIGQP